MFEFYSKDCVESSLYGKDVTHFVTRKILNNLIKLIQMNDNHATKSSLILLIIDTFTQTHILNSEEESTLDYYALSFLNFVKVFGKNLESRDLQNLVDLISLNIIPFLVKREDQSYDSTYTYFNSLGTILQHTEEEIRSTTTKNCFNYISNMLRFAETADQLQLCTQSIVNFLYSHHTIFPYEVKMYKPDNTISDSDIIILKLHRAFVARIQPKITLDNYMEPEYWKLESFSSSETEFMIELRKSIMRLMS